MSFALSGLLTSLSLASVRHPCQPDDLLGPDQYTRKSMVIFPVQFEPGLVETPLPYRGRGPLGRDISGDEALLKTVTQGLFAVDYPLPRFDAWSTSSAPTISGQQLLVAGGGPTADALSCTDSVAVPRVSAYETERDTTQDKNGKTTVTFDVELTMELDVYQRDGTGALTRTHTLRAAAPRMLDVVEDMMSDARSATIDQALDAVPDREKTLARAQDGADILLASLPAEQSEELASIINQTGLAVTRVASIARPVWPAAALDSDLRFAKSGVGWRATEEQCYLDPPKSEDQDYEARALECAVLNRTRQSIRALQLSTREIPSFRLYAPVEVAEARSAQIVLGSEEGLNVGDGYWLREGEERVGYARVQSVGPGGRAGAEEVSTLQIVYKSPTAAASLSGQENPQLGIEVGPWLGAIPASRPTTALPDDPIEGGPRTLESGARAFAGSLRFDVNLGGAAQMFEWYQTNRISRGGVGELSYSQAVFGVERRYLVAPRLYLFGGAAAGFQTWSLPSGDVKYNDDNEPRELKASASRLGLDVETGPMFMLTPSVLARLSLSGRLSRGVDEFRYTPDGAKDDVPVALETAGGEAFDLRTSGLALGASTVWVF